LCLIPQTVTPKCPHNHEKPIEYLKSLLPFLMDAFVIEHILPKFLMDLFMMWSLCQVNHVCWMVRFKHFETSQHLLLPHNCPTRTSKVVFEQHMQFEMNYLELCVLDDENIWDFSFEYNHIVHTLLFWSNLVFMGNQLNLKPIFRFAIEES
jgi:hypothetical protein